MISHGIPISHAIPTFFSLHLLEFPQVDEVSGTGPLGRGGHQGSEGGEDPWWEAMDDNFHGNLMVLLFYGKIL